MDFGNFDDLPRSLLESPTRRGIGRFLTHLGLGGALGRVGLIEGVAKKKRKKQKKRCKAGKKKCGKGCCGALSRCVRAICYCTGKEPPGAQPCRDVAATLIELIAEVSGKEPAEIGAQPDEPLQNYVVLLEDVQEEIDKRIEETFEIAEPVPYYEEGIATAAELIREELQDKG